MESKNINIAAECLYDPGATLSIVSSQVWDITNQSSPSVLESFDSNVFEASEETVNVKGKTTALVEINGLICICQVIVADIDVGVILGFNFLRDHKGIIDVTRSMLTQQAKTCELKCSGLIGCNCIVMSDTTEIPAMSEMIIEGKVVYSNKSFKGLSIV